MLIPKGRSIFPYEFLNLNNVPIGFNPSTHPQRYCSEAIGIPNSIFEQAISSDPPNHPNFNVVRI